MFKTFFPPQTDGMIRSSFNIGCSESKVIFKWRKTNKNNNKKRMKRLYRPLQGANVRTSCISQTQSTRPVMNTQKSPPWACDKGCAEACAERFSALNPYSRCEGERRKGGRGRGEKNYASHFRKSGHARLIRGCFSFSQCFRAGVFPFLSTPPPRSLWLAPFPSLFGKFQHDAFASKLRAQRKRRHCRLVEIERFALGGAQNRPPRPLGGFDTNPRWRLIMQSARSRSYGKIGDFEQSNLSGDTYEIHWSYLLSTPKNIQVSVKLITCSMVPGSWLSRACRCSPETCKCLP